MCPYTIGLPFILQWNSCTVLSSESRKVSPGNQLKKCHCDVRYIGWASFEIDRFLLNKAAYYACGLDQKSSAAQKKIPFSDTGPHYVYYYSTKVVRKEKGNSWSNASPPVFPDFSYKL